MNNEFRLWDGVCFKVNMVSVGNFTRMFQSHFIKHMRSKYQIFSRWSNEGADWNADLEYVKREKNTYFNNKINVNAKVEQFKNGWLFHCWCLISLKLKFLPHAISANGINEVMAAVSI